MLLKNCFLKGLAVIVAAVTLAVAQTPSTGWFTDNPDADTFYIANANGLAGLAELVNNSDENYFLEKTIILTDNIDLSDYGKNSPFNDRKGWIPIGKNRDDVFSCAVFDGNGKTISGLYINDDTAWQLGLFGVISDSTIVKNLGVIGVNISSGNSGGEVGGIAAVTTDACIINTYVTGVVSGKNRTGGIVGELWGSISNSYFAGDIIGDGYLTGGIAGGLGTGNITNCYTVGTISSNSEDIGGIVGGIRGSGSVVSNAALSMILNRTLTGWRVRSLGRIIGTNFGDITPANNVAFSGMTNGGVGEFTGANTLDGLGGADITVIAIAIDGTIGGRFTNNNGWTTENGKLPGFGVPVEFPAYFTNPAIPVITHVTISHTTIEVRRGASRLFTATVTGVNNPTQTVTWSVEGGIAATQISANGMLSIAANETAEKLTVRATSTADTTKSATAIVTIPFFSTGYGSASAPYPIETPEQLIFIAERVSIGDTAFNNKHYRLVNDIDLSAYGSASPFNDGKGWTPIGTTDNPFFGAFDGNNKTISELYINNSEHDYIGLFGNVNGGPIKNLNVSGAKITGGDYVGGIVGSIVGNLEYNNFTGSVSGNNNIGGLVGLITGNASLCHSTGTVNGNDYVGGLAGALGGDVANSYSTAAVSGNNNVGGLLGYFIGSINNCYSAGTVSGTGTSDDVGGLVGNTIGGALSTATASYWDIEASTQTLSAAGDGKSTADMKMLTTYANWDFDNIWDMDNNVDYPHLKPPTVTSVSSYSRVIPHIETAAVVPVNVLTGEFSAGPNPIGKSSSAMNFFRQGKSIKNGTLIIYNISGNVIKKITINDNAITGNSARRQVASWDLTDRRGRLVSEGTYLVKGTVTTSDGKREKVSLVLGVR